MWKKYMNFLWGNIDFLTRQVCPLYFTITYLYPMGVYFKNSLKLRKLTVETEFKSFYPQMHSLCSVYAASASEILRYSKSTTLFGWQLFLYFSQKNYGVEEVGSSGSDLNGTYLSLLKVIFCDRIIVDRIIF